MYYKLCRNKQDVKEFVRKLKSKHGFKIANLREFNEQLKTIRLIKKQDMKTREDEENEGRGSRRSRRNR